MNKENLENLLTFAKDLGLMNAPFINVYQEWQEAEKDYENYMKTRAEEILHDPDIGAEQFKDAEWYEGLNFLNY